jgi:hypothetical protein
MKVFCSMGLIIFVLFSYPSPGSGHPQFEVLIPWGTTLSCTACHWDEQFRFDLQANFYIWDLTLASMDSDGDGYSNGTELQDPSGEWNPLEPDPGEFDLVSNPDDHLNVPGQGLGIEDEVCAYSPPKAYALAQNYPNPVTHGTDIAYAIPRSERVDLTIYTISGRAVRQLVSAEQIRGRYTVHWDGRDTDGRRVADGIYLVKIRAGNFTATNKLVLLK